MEEIKIKILEIYELNKSLNIKVETKYGIDILGLGLHTKFLDPETDLPLWRKEVRKLLENKYLNKIKKEEIIPEDIFEKEITFDQLCPKKEIKFVENKKR